MSKHKKLLHICFIFAFIYMMMCPVVHALHDRYIAHAVFNFSLHTIIQKYIKGDLKVHQEGILYFPLFDYRMSGFAQNFPLCVSANPSINLFIVTTTRLNL